GAPGAREKEQDMPTRIWFALAALVAIGCGGSHTPTGPVDMAGAACAHCSAPAACCNNACIDVSKNNANCGACGHVCGAGTVCMGGACTCPGGGTCSGSQVCCPNGVGCKNTSNDSQ